MSVAVDMIERAPSKTKKQLVEMFALQDSMNSVVNPGWKSANYPWLDAIMVEAVEAFDHTNWKWWKDTTAEPDWDQVRMEVVDVWHFLISKMISENWGTNLEKMSIVIDGMGQAPSVEDKDSFHCAIKDVVTEATLDRPSSTGRIFHHLLSSMVYCGLSFQLVHWLYLGKNTLNIFRQNHGYKEGTYVKMWNCKEDNEVLTEILQTWPIDGPELTFETLTERLEAEYPSVTSEDLI